MIHKILGSFVAVLSFLFLFQVSPSICADHLVTNIVLTPPTPNILAFNQDVTFTFDYTTTDTDGVQIFGRPYTSTGLASNCTFYGEGLVYLPGTGSGRGGFTITSGKVRITRIGFEIWNAFRTKLLFRGFIPVNYQFK